MTFFTRALENWWALRVERMKHGEKLSPVNIRGILYILRMNVGVENMPKKSSFYSALNRVEQRYSVPREKLGIITEPKINLVTRFDEKPILKANESELKDVCALVYIEKSTIIAAIEEDKSLTDRGIHIVKAMGFSTRDVNRTIRLAQELGAPILTLMDFDPSGILIDLKIRESGVKTVRLGIDLELVKELGLRVEDVREPLPREPKKLAHFKYLKRTHPDLADIFVNVVGDGKKPYRIEIDGVFALAGKDRFMDAVLKRADKVVQVKPLQKALLFRHVPEKVDKLRWAIFGLLDKLFERIADESLEPYKNLKQSFTEIRLSEIEGKIEQRINENAEAGSTVKLLEATVTEIAKLLGEQVTD